MFDWESSDYIAPGLAVLIFFGIAGYIGASALFPLTGDDAIIYITATPANTAIPIPDPSQVYATDTETAPSPPTAIPPSETPDSILVPTETHTAQPSQTATLCDPEYPYCEDGKILDTPTAISP